jgi:hypothetical protein
VSHRSRRRFARVLVACAIALLQARSAQALDWRSLLDQATGSPAAGTAARAALGTDEVVAGLKEALARGAEDAVARLGRHDGFLGDPAVRIPLPRTLDSAATVMRALGQGRYPDEFEATMNRAAERAVPESGAILGDAIRNLGIDEARRILDGPEDAATRYFRKVSEQRLTTALRPVVSKATSRVGVTAAYKRLVAEAGPATALLGSDIGDLDGYVTQQTLDGLFTVIAAEERRIRRDPAARTTELLRRVFGGAD